MGWFSDATAAGVVIVGFILVAAFLGIGLPAIVRALTRFLGGG